VVSSKFLAMRSVKIGLPT